MKCDQISLKTCLKLIKSMLRILEVVIKVKDI